MKIGLYSLPFHSNYGGVLQSYALQNVLKSMGHEVYVLNQNWLDIVGKRDRIMKTIYSISNIFTSKKRYDQRTLLKMSIHELQRFWTSNTDNLVNFKEFEEIKRLQLDAIIVGSDQIWRKGYCKDTRWYFLDFTKGWDIKRVAYGASFGVSEWQFDEVTTRDMRDLISCFNGVSVREKDALGLCKDYLERDAVFVLDPTFLLSIEDYQHFSVKKDKPGVRNIVSFMLHPTLEKKNIVHNLAKDLSVEVDDIDIPMKEEDKHAVESYKSVESWLTAMMNADYVITDSYHGMAFAINFNKPFVTLGNLQGGQARFISLLETFNLSDRLSEDYDRILSLFKKDINWNMINDIKESMKNNSFSFIEKSLL